MFVFATYVAKLMPARGHFFFLLLTAQRISILGYDWKFWECGRVLGENRWIFNVISKFLRVGFVKIEESIYMKQNNE